MSDTNKSLKLVNILLDYYVFINVLNNNLFGTNWNCETETFK
jgi:hypothetical protein